MKRLLSMAATMLALCAAGLPPARASVIDIPILNLLAGSWGPGSGQSYGQIFTAPSADAFLFDYSFRVGANVQFQFVSQVYAWGGSTATGPALFTSESVLTPLPLNSLATYVFSPSIPVIGGHQYIAFVTNQPDGIPFGGPLESSGTMALNQDDLYAAGQFAFNTGGNPATGPWSLTLGNADAVFHATFVSEPATLVLFACGLAGLIGVTAVVRRRSSRCRPRHARMVCAAWKRAAEALAGPPQDVACPPSLAEAKSLPKPSARL